jgi:hypothetical protein
MSLCQGQSSHSAGGKDVTQTCLKNHCNETSRAALSTKQRSVLCDPKKDGSPEFKGWIRAEGTLERLKKRIGEPACKHWFRDVEFVAYRDDIIVLSVPSVFYRDSITNRYEPLLLACFSPDYPKLFRIELEVRGHHGDNPDREQVL